MRLHDKDNRFVIDDKESKEGTRTTKKQAII